MSSHAAAAPRTISPTGLARGLAVTAGLGVGAYFVWKYVPQYFVFTEASYGGYFWPRASWVLPHVALALTATVIGPLQLWARVRDRYRRFHRIAGRTYIIAVAGGAAASIGLSTSAGFTPAYRCGLFFLAIAWLATTGMAFAAVRRRNFTQHREWMIRSYVVTFSFVTFRVFRDIAVAHGLATFGEMNAVMAWACWAVPLLITEIWFQSRAIFRTSGAVTSS